MTAVATVAGKLLALSAEVAVSVVVVGRIAREY